jgi:transglutaminase-like putative cysteine protease
LKARSRRNDTVLKSISEKLPDALLAVLVAFSITFSLASAMCLTYPPASILLVILVMTVVFLFIFYNRTTAIVTVALFGTALVSSLIYILHYKLFEDLIEFFDGYFFWLYDFMMYPETPDPTYQIITVMVLCLLVSVLSYIFVVWKFRFLVVLAAGISVFAIQAVYRIAASIVPFYLFLAAALISYLKHVYMIKSSKEDNDYAKPPVLLLWSIPISVLIILLASSIHASDKPIQWKWLDQKITSIYNQFKEGFDYETFDYFSLSASSGFGDSDGFLGGRVRLDRTNVLQITTNRRIYLRGASKDVYTGNKWTNSVDALTPSSEDPDSLFSDAGEMLEGLKILTGNDELPNGYFIENSVLVTFLNLKTKSLFIPSKMNFFKIDSDEMTTYLSDTGDLSSGERLSKNFAYRMSSYIPAVGSQQFEDALRKSKKGLYDEYLTQLRTSMNLISLENTVRNAVDDEMLSDPEDEMLSNPEDEMLSDPEAAESSDSGEDAEISSYSMEELQQRYDTVLEFKKNSDGIYEKYLQLPDDLPQRIKDLAASLVLSADNDYDKARAIEEYVAENFTYNLDVRSTPRNRDFVDYFLFDQQEGYCSYFASAMTILARCAGLPARYVEGYMLPPEPEEGKYNSYVVTNMQAHAWTEIYFEGFGWLPFEPTPPFRNVYYTVDVQQYVNISPNYNAAYDYYMEMMRRFYSQDPTRIREPFPVYTRKGPDLADIATKALIAVGALFILLLTFNAVRSKLRLFRLTTLAPGASVIGHYDYYIKSLKIIGFGIEPAETPYQYSARIDKLLYFSPVRFRHITDIFVKVRYSSHGATENEKQLFTEFNPGFLTEIRLSMGSLKYFVLKYILGRI